MIKIPSGSDWESWIANGDFAFDNRDYSRALNFYAPALQQNPDNPLILSKMGNVFFEMQLYSTANNFYEQSLTNSGAYIVIYEYVLTPMEPPTLSILQENLSNQYHVEIITEGLQFILNNIQKELQEQPTQPSINIKQAQPWEQLITNLFKQAGISFTEDLIDVTHQIKQAIIESSQGKQQMTLSKRMNWVQFENFLQNLFEKQGYSVERLKKTHDYGADLILRKRGITIAVQAKHRKSTIGVRAIQEVFASMAYYGADHGLVITTGKFTQFAQKLAKKLGIETWDWKRLITEFRVTYTNNNVKPLSDKY